MTGYDFHPEALWDLDEIWNFIANDNPAAADQTITDVLTTIRKLVTFPHQGHRRPDLTSRPLRFTRVYATRLLTRRMNSLSGWLPSFMAAAVRV